MSTDFEKIILNTLTEIKVAIARIEEHEKGQDEKYASIMKTLDKHEKRIRALESKPSKWWDRLMTIIITGITTTFIAWFLNTK